MKRILASVPALLLAATLTACTPMPAHPDVPASLLHDELFAAAPVPADPAQLFDLSPEMQAFLRRELLHAGNATASLQALADAMARSEVLRLSYDASHTRDAAETFRDRAGNCLSLVIMTAAFARALDLEVSYREARIEPYWSRQGDLLVASGHVNLQVMPRLINQPDARPHGGYLFDFLEPHDADWLPSQNIPESRVVAMYLNNRAAEALLDGHPDLAYGWARLALQRHPDFAPAYNTLGLLYLKRGRPDIAVAAFRAALLRSADDPPVLSNLAEALEQSGDTAEARAIHARLERLSPGQPFQLLDQGVAAYRRREYHAAAELFRREAKLADYNPDLHYWMGRNAWAMGQSGRARSELEQALQLSATPEQRTRYAAKLEWLREQARTTN